MDLREFLLARIAEDEAVARAATPGPWGWWNLEGVDQGWNDQGPNLQQAGNEWKSCPYYCRWPEGDVNHRGEQAKPGHEHRVTEEVVGSWGSDAHGVSIEDSDAQHIARHDPARILAECAAKRAIVEHWGPFETLEGPDLMLTLAAVYSAHPDYDPAWAQEASQA